MNRNFIWLLICMVFVYADESHIYEGTSRSKKVSISKAPKFPPYLEASIIFTEPSKNNFLDAEETGLISVTIKNTGKGKAKGVSFIINSNSKSNLDFLSYHDIGHINSGGKKKIDIPITADFDIKSKLIELTFIFSESNNFYPDPIKLSFNTHKFVHPELVVVSGVDIKDADNNGMIESGEYTTVTSAIQNIGQGNAKKVSIELRVGENVYFGGESKKEFYLGTLKPGQSKEFTFDIYTNKEATEIPVFVSIYEYHGRFGSENIRLPLEFKKRISTIQEVEIVGIQSEGVDITHAQSYDIDIEKDIPQTGYDNKNAVAVIIGNRDYESDIPMVDFAIRDAQFVKEYAIKTLGYREGNILYYNNATLSNMKVAFNKLKNIVKSNKSDVFIYYSGHGAPDPESNQGYFVPVDADPNYIKESGYAVNHLYALLNDINPRTITVVIDACFSGSSDQGMILKDISPVFIEVDQSKIMRDSAAIFTSSRGEEVSSWYREKKHSLFTYYFLKALQGEGDINNDKQLTLLEIESYIDEHVPYMARRLNNRQQTPQLDTFNRKAILVKY